MIGTSRQPCPLDAVHHPDGRHFPFTRLVVGTTVGTWAAVVPLTVAITPLFARLAEAAMREVDRGLIEAAESMGATPFQIILQRCWSQRRFPGIVAGQTVGRLSA